MREKDSTKLDLKVEVKGFTLEFSAKNTLILVFVTSIPITVVVAMNAMIERLF